MLNQGGVTKLTNLTNNTSRYYIVEMKRPLWPYFICSDVSKRQLLSLFVDEKVNFLKFYSAKYGAKHFLKKLTLLFNQVNNWIIISQFTDDTQFPSNPFLIITPVCRYHGLIHCQQHSYQIGNSSQTKRLDLKYFL